MDDIRSQFFLLIQNPLVMNLSSGISKLVRPCPGRSRGRLAGVSKAEGGKVSWFGAAGDI